MLETWQECEIVFCVQAVLDDCNFFTYWHTLTYLSNNAFNKIVCEYVCLLGKT